MFLPTILPVRGGSLAGFRVGQKARVFPCKSRRSKTPCFLVQNAPPGRFFLKNGALAREGARGRGGFFTFCTCFCVQNAGPERVLCVFTCPAALPPQMGARGAARRAPDLLRMRGLWAHFSLPGKNVERRIYCVFTCPAARPGCFAAGPKRGFHAYLRCVCAFPIFPIPGQRARLLRMRGVCGLFLAARGPWKVRFGGPRLASRAPMRGHPMRMYRVFAVGPPRRGGRQGGFHAYVRHLGAQRARRGRRCGRNSCVFTVFPRVSASRRRAPRPFSCVFVASWHGFGPAAGCANRQNRARCINAARDLMRMCRVLGPSGPENLRFCARGRARFMRISRTWASGGPQSAKTAESMRICGGLARLAAPGGAPCGRPGAQILCVGMGFLPHLRVWHHPLWGGRKRGFGTYVRHLGRAGGASLGTRRGAAGGQFVRIYGVSGPRGKSGTSSKRVFMRRCRVWA